MRAARFFLAMVVCGVLLVFFGGKGLITAVLPAQYIYADDCDWTKLKSGQRVVVDFDFVLEPFEETTEDGRSVSSIYTVPDLRQADDGMIYMTHFMVVVVNATDYSQYDRLVDDSWAWWDMEYDQLGERGTISFEGSFRKMKKNEQEFLHDYLKDAGYSDSEIDEMIIPLVMVKSQSFLTNVLMFVGGIALTLIGVVPALIAFIKKRG